MDIRNILVATDFSDDAKAALEAAVDLSEVFGAKLRIVHAYHIDYPAVYGGIGSDYALPPDLIEPLRQGAESSVEDLLKELNERGVDASGHVVMGHPARTILDESKVLPADLIVMGTRGFTGIKHALIGSNAERVVRLAECPVLTIKSSADE